MSGWNAGRGVLLPQTAPRSHCEPRLVLTCVRVSRTVVERARISAVLTACARRALPAVRARGAGVATRVLFVCCRRVCDMASTFLFSFFQSAGRSFIVVGRARVEGGVGESGNKCRV